MKVIDLIHTLQQLPSDLEVMVDVSTPEMEQFAFAPVVFADEVETVFCDHIVLLSPVDLHTVETEPESSIG